MRVPGNGSSAGKRSPIHRQADPCQNPESENQSHWCAQWLHRQWTISTWLLAPIADSTSSETAHLRQVGVAIETAHLLTESAAGIDGQRCRPCATPLRSREFPALMRAACAACRPQSPSYGENWPSCRCCCAPACLARIAQFDRARQTAHRVDEEHCCEAIGRWLLAINLFNHLAGFALDHAEALV